MGSFSLAHVVIAGHWKRKPNPAKLGLVSSVPNCAKPVIAPYPASGTGACSATLSAVQRVRQRDEGKGIHDATCFRTGRSAPRPGFSSRPRGELAAVARPVPQWLDDRDRPANEVQRDGERPLGHSTAWRQRRDPHRLGRPHLPALLGRCHERPAGPLPGCKKREAPVEQEDGEGPTELPQQHGLAVRRHRRQDGLVLLRHHEPAGLRLRGESPVEPRPREGPRLQRRDVRLQLQPAPLQGEALHRRHPQQAARLLRRPCRPNQRADRILPARH